MAERLSTLLLIFFSALAARAAYCAFRGELGVSPPTHYREFVIAGSEYVRQGRQVCPLMGNGASLAPSSLVPPVYCWIAACVYRLFGIETFTATLILQLINCAAGALTCVLIYLMALELTGPACARGIAIAAVAHPLLLGFSGLIWETSLFILASSAALLASLMLARRPFRATEYLLFGAYLGCTAMLNPALTIAYPFLVGRPLFLRPRRDRRAAVTGTLAALTGWAVAITPWTVRNANAFGELFYIRNNFWHEVWMGVCPEAGTSSGLAFDQQFALRNEEVRMRLETLGERDFFQESATLARAAIQSEPWRYLRLCAARAVDFWIGTVFSHRETPSDWRTVGPVRAAVMYLLWVELFLLVAGLLIDTRVRWLVCMALLYSITYSITHVELRYRAPVEPMILLACAVTLNSLALRWRAEPRQALSESGPT